MILLTSEYIKILLRLNIVQTMFKQNILQYLKIITEYVPILSVIISLSYFINIYLQVSIFHITLKITEISVLFILYNLSLNLNKISYNIIYKNHNNTNKLHTSNYESLSVFYNNNSDKTSDPKYTHLINVQNDILEYIKIKKHISTLTNSALYYYGISMTLWSIENLFCNFTHFLQLHSLWHILSSIGVYKLNQIILNYTLINNLLYKDQNKDEETQAGLDSDYDIDEYKMDEQLIDTDSDQQSSEQVTQKKINDLKTRARADISEEYF